MDKYIKVTVVGIAGGDATFFGKITPAQLDRLRPLFTAISNFTVYDAKAEDGKMDWTHSDNFPWGECQREDLGEKSPEQIYVETGLVTAEDLNFFANNFIPYPENGFHSIDSIQVFNVDGVEILF